MGGDQPSNQTGRIGNRYDQCRCSSTALNISCQETKPKFGAVVENQDFPCDEPPDEK